MASLYVRVGVWHTLTAETREVYLRKYRVVLTDDRDKPYAYEVES